MNSSDLANQLCGQFPESLGKPLEFRGEITLEVLDAEKIVEICQHAKHALGFDFLLDIASVDNYGDDPRWTIVYELSGIDIGCLLRLKTQVSEDPSELPSVSGVWPTANWHEREIYDMMGIRFRGHPDLRRILMWEGYPYHPLRKDFPLGGKPSETLDVAFSRTAPLEGGPFVTTADTADAGAREPRSRDQES
jgi:NADH-quinone oxidoreductase subunit C